MMLLHTERQTRLLTAGGRSGAEYHCYCSDITCSYPVSGVFDDRQKMIYNGVLNAVRAVEEAMRPGITWPDMHRLATRSLLEHLTANGLLVGDVDEMVKVNLGKIFFPCGLGHFVGLDTHDVGGYLEGFVPQSHTSCDRS